MTPFPIPFHSCAPSSKIHQTRRSGRNYLPISAEVALPRLQNEINVALFLFASNSFLALFYGTADCQNNCNQWEDT